MTGGVNSQPTALARRATASAAPIAGKRIARGLAHASHQARRRAACRRESHTCPCPGESASTNPYSCSRCRNDSSTGVDNRCGTKTRSKRARSSATSIFPSSILKTAHSSSRSSKYRNATGSNTTHRSTAAARSITRSGRIRTRSRLIATPKSTPLSSPVATAYRDCQPPPKSALDR